MERASASASGASCTFVFVTLPAGFFAAGLRAGEGRFEVRPTRLPAFAAVFFPAGFLPDESFLPDEGFFLNAGFFFAGVFFFFAAMGRA
jgi:hypothetical protein